MSIWATCCLWAYVSRDHSGRFWAWGSFWLRKAQGQEKWQFPALINEHTGRSFCLQDQRPVDTCSGTEKIINKDPAFVSSWAPLNLFDLDKEEEKTVNITLKMFCEVLTLKWDSSKNCRNLSIPKTPQHQDPYKKTLFFLKPAYFFFKYKVQGF